MLVMHWQLSYKVARHPICDEPGSGRLCKGGQHVEKTQITSAAAMVVHCAALVMDDENADILQL